MNSIIFIAKNQHIIDTYLDTFYKEHNISPFDRGNIAEEGSIGIESIRLMQEHLFLKPYKGEKKSIVIHNAHLLTIEAQNALLKVLEEPPYFVYFVLVAPTLQNFLPTILSRCQLDVGEKETTSYAQEEIERVQRDLIAFTQDAPLSSKLSLAEKIAGEKENMQQWLETAILFLRDTMLSEITNHQDATHTIQLLSRLQNALETYQTTNINPRILLEHTFLSL